MADSHRDVDYSVPEWWDREGNHYDYEPSAAELEDEAVQITVHMTGGDKHIDAHFTSFSNIGWTEQELADDVVDAYNSGHYDEQ